jgi:methionine synthase II (cobalamin-independent)
MKIYDKRSKGVVGAMNQKLLTQAGVAGRPMLIGSFPKMSLDEAFDLVLEYVPDIPNWVQMPGIAEEGMLAQFATGFPGLKQSETHFYIDTSTGGFDEDMLCFYEEYMAVAENRLDNDASRFILSPGTASGFFSFLKRIESMAARPMAVKGQITGPFTFSTGMKDQNGRALFYDDQTRDMAVKLIAMKAAWQVKRLYAIGVPVILFIDEPSLAGFGSSEFISISRESVKNCLSEVIDAIHDAGGIAGIHVCANTDWSIIMETGADIINFDAYSFFDRFVLYGQHIVDLFNSGRWLAWGMIPTLHVEDIQKETHDSLLEQFYSKLEKISSLGIERSLILNQSMITPSCGAGSLSLDLSKKVLKLTRKVAEIIRNEVDVC